MNETKTGAGEIRFVINGIDHSRHVSDKVDTGENQKGGKTEIAYRIIFLNRHMDTESWNDYGHPDHNRSPKDEQENSAESAATHHHN